MCAICSHLWDLKSLEIYEVAFILRSLKVVVLL